MSSRAIDRIRRTFEAVPTSAGDARRFVTDTLQQHSATCGDIADMALVVSELTTNIIQHGDGTNLSVFVDVADPEWWQLLVVGGHCEPHSHVLRPETWTVSRASDASGRGLGIVRQVMDEISVDASGGAISIRCRKRREKSPA